MRYILLDTDKFIKFDEERLKSEVKSRALLTERQNQIIEHLALISLPMSDQELLAWAKIHNPEFNREVERNELSNELAVIQADLEAIS